jgi:hypothetical protein
VNWEKMGRVNLLVATDLYKYMKSPRNDVHFSAIHMCEQKYTFSSFIILFMQPMKDVILELNTNHSLLLLIIFFFNDIRPWIIISMCIQHFKFKLYLQWNFLNRTPTDDQFIQVELTFRIDRWLIYTGWINIQNRQMISLYRLN